MKFVKFLKPHYFNKYYHKEFGEIIKHYDEELINKGTILPIDERLVYFYEDLKSLNIIKDVVVGDFFISEDTGGKQLSIRLSDIYTIIDNDDHTTIFSSNGVSVSICETYEDIQEILCAYESTKN